MKLVLFAAGSLLLLALCTSTSMAQVQRTFVSAFGNDGNPCSRGAPCRTVATAIGQTNVGGEVAILDSAGYGAFTISQAVTVQAPPGVYAGVSVFSGDGIGVSAGANDVVTLRGLTVNAQGTSGSGIVFHSGAALHIENCVINGFGANFQAGVLLFGAGQLFIKDTILKGNATGVDLQPTSGKTFAAMENVTMNGNTTGLFVGPFTSAQLKAAIVRSAISGNIDGIFVQGNGATALGLLDIESCLITNNGGTGLNVVTFNGGSAAASISNCLISHNVVGYFIEASASILSRGNNTIIGNGSNGIALTPLAGQ